MKEAITLGKCHVCTAELMTGRHSPPPSHCPRASSWRSGLTATGSPPRTNLLVRVPLSIRHQDVSHGVATALRPVRPLCPLSESNTGTVPSSRCCSAPSPGTPLGNTH